MVGSLTGVMVGKFYSRRI